MRFEIDNFLALREALSKICGEIAAQGVPDGRVFDCKVVVDELVSNVLQHGGGRAYLSVCLAEYIEIRVRGEQAFRPPKQSVCSAVDEERGRGLYLVDALSFRRSYSEEDGIVVLLTK